jgi:hypothetical protein
VTTTYDTDPAAGEPGEPTPGRGTPWRLKPLTVAAVSSLSAGAIHAAAIGAHAETPPAARVFVAAAAFQVGWGAVALTRQTKRVAYVGAIGNAALFIGWVLAKTKGLNFISGLDSVEPIQIADGLCAALALLSTVAASLVFLGVRPRQGRPILAGTVVALLALSAVPGMVEAGKHVHGGHTDGPATVVVAADGQAQVVNNAAAVVPPKPFDPTKPIDLGGVAGVTPEEQARAENLIALTLIRLPQWTDSAVAEAKGFHSIGDGVTGYEHLINWSYINDDKTLDPDYPESLVYHIVNGKRVLESAMYMLPPGSTLDSVPDIGGALTQWHIHDNLCFTNDPVAPHVAGLTDSKGNCSAPTVKLQPVPMIHVWIVPKPCGPFAALEGVGAGQVKPGETHACDHVHGSTQGL